MKQIFIAIAIFILLTGSALAQDQGFGHSWDNQNTYMQPYKSDAYGPGIHTDATGKPFQWKTNDGQNSTNSNGVKPDAYGPGVGMDQYGRAVKPGSWPR